MDHGTVLQDSGVAVHLPDIGLLVAILRGDLVLSQFVIFWVLAGLEPDHAAALPGVNLVLPAVVVQLDVAEEMLLLGLPVFVRLLANHVVLDAEVPETSSVQGVLVDSAALVGGALWVDLVLETGNVTERSAPAITHWLCEAFVVIAPDLIVDPFVSAVKALIDLFSLPVVTILWIRDVPSLTIQLNLAFSAKDETCFIDIKGIRIILLGDSGTNESSDGKRLVKHVLLVFFFYYKWV
jgi:hypothetical protein